MATIDAKIIGLEKLERAMLEAFAEWTKEDVNEAHWSDQFKEMGRWQYPNDTRRKNGEVVESPRDIYDLGALYDSGVQSYKITVGKSKAEANWHWNATNSSGQEYAWYVHEGRGTNVKAREFTDDIAIAPSFFRKAPGMAFMLRMQAALNGLNAN